MKSNAGLLLLVSVGLLHCGGSPIVSDDGSTGSDARTSTDTGTMSDTGTRTDTSTGMDTGTPTDTGSPTANDAGRDVTATDVAVDVRITDVGAPTNLLAQEFVQAHNIARAGVMPVPSTPIPLVTWDDALAVVAQQWADGCQFQHSTNSYGENLSANAPPGNKTPTQVVAGWDAEKSNYNYAANTCSGTCGHYTQVVWRGSIRIGCGHKVCSTNTPFGPNFPNWDLWVCNYAPAGNNGSRPY